MLKQSLFVLVALPALLASAVTVEVEDVSAGRGSVTWSQKTVEGGMASLALKASAESGFTFAGWYVDGSAPKWGVDERNPSISGVLVPTNSSVTASFVDCAEDTLQFDFSELLTDLECGKPFSATLDVDSVSFPSLAFKGLPSGLSYNSKTLVLSGTPRTPCWNLVVVNGVNESGYTFTQTLRASVNDIDSARMAGVQTELPIGEYYFSEFPSLFGSEDERTSTKLTGLPPGLEWKESWDLLYGTPTKSGTYVVKAVVRFADGVTETATMRFVVSAPSPSEYGAYVEGLAWLTVGDKFEVGDMEIGAYANGEGVTSVSGLPPGLSPVSWVGGETRHYGVSGTVLMAGAYTVKVGFATDIGGTIANIVTEQEIIVTDAPNRYLKVSVLDSPPKGGGTVFGGGPIPVAQGAAVSAKTSSGYVFAGWHDSDGLIADVGEGNDYRSPSLVYGADTAFEFMELFARFARRDEDSELTVYSLDGATFSFSSDSLLDEEFEIDSLSLPTVSAKGLPAGVSVVPSYEKSYRLFYDPDMATKTPSPGRYSATLTAKNKSGAADSATFMLEVANIVDERINVENDYGELTPEEEIAPIDLSDAVDFASGETLSVSGLPRGLKYNNTANAKKGIEANTITGTPMVPGHYTLEFNARVVASATTNSNGRVAYTYDTATATAFMTVLPYPMISVFIEDDAAEAGNKVTGAGNYKPGRKATLKAKAAKEWVFAGWDAFDVEWPATLSPTLSVVTGSEGQDITANFVPVSEDMLEIMEPYESESGFAAELVKGVEVSGQDCATLVYDIVDSVSYPTVKVSELPSGVKFSPSTLLLSGVPTKTGVYYVTVSAKNAGGYSFTRILRVAVCESEGSLPEEPIPDNAAGIDFTPLQGLVTGMHYAPGEVQLTIGASPVTGALPTKVNVSGVPRGLSAVVESSDGVLAVSFVGTPSKVARSALTMTVTYADRKSLTSKAFVTTLDGGSSYLFVSSLDESIGTATGGGVYSAGSTVKLVAKPKAKCVFAGWLTADGELDGYGYFVPMSAVDGIDPRTAKASFPFRPWDFDFGNELYAYFVPRTNDTDIAVGLAADAWEINPDEPSEFSFEVDSLSLPSVTAKNLPKGVKVDVARGKLVYTPTSTVKSGIYHATLTAKNLSKATDAAEFEIRVANRTTSMIRGLDPSMDAYSLSVGVQTGDDFIVPEVDEGVRLKVSGLPSGLAFKNGVVSGMPKKAGSYTVTFTATSGSGSTRQTGVATITIVVSALPSELVGTFNGFVYADPDDEDSIAGTFIATVTTAGKISATIKTNGGTDRYGASGWSSFDASNGIAHAHILQKNGSLLSFSVDSSADWTSWQLNGTNETADAEQLFISAQRNPFGAKDGNADAIAVAAALAGTYSNEGVKLTVNKKGEARFSGKYNGRSISGSTLLLIASSGDIHAKLLIIDNKKGNIVLDVSFNVESGDVTWIISCE